MGAEVVLVGPASEVAQESRRAERETPGGFSGAPYNDEKIIPDKGRLGTERFLKNGPT